MKKNLFLFGLILFLGSCLSELDEELIMESHEPEAFEDLQFSSVDYPNAEKLLPLLKRDSSNNWRNINE